jgi:hypothetical protein
MHAKPSYFPRFLGIWMQGRRLRFASGGDNYGERSETKKFFCSRRDNPPRNSETSNAGIKVAGSIPLTPPASAPMFGCEVDEIPLTVSFV